MIGPDIISDHYKDENGVTYTWYTACTDNALDIREWEGKCLGRSIS